ncbi:MAG: GDSL-type esterase/lipase family protein [Dysgonamonadaceae bacterium]|nr:GDSL-type esterase/lipase family protein [Dysgonamonadaceae bacterium]
MTVSTPGNISQCGSYTQLSAVATPAGALLPEIRWSVDKENVARITESGKLYAKANGTLTVTAKALLAGGATLTATKTLDVAGQNTDNYSLTVMGSSLPWGQGAEPRDVNGYTWLWADYLQNRAAHTWTSNNISIGGNTTADLTRRWDTDLLPSCSRYVYYGLSLGNEGIHEQGEVAFNSWRDNMLALIDRTRKHDKIPVIGNNYPRGDFNAADYNYVKQLNLLVHQWDVPSVNLLGAIDNGYGQWATGYVADNAHPNTAGHAELSYAIVPSLLDALAAGKPQPVHDGNASLTLAKTDKVKRIAWTPEGTLHSFTLAFSFRTTGTGTVASFVTAAGDTVRLTLANNGQLTYKTQSSTAGLNNGEWHTAVLTHHHAGGRTQLYVDSVKIQRPTISERLFPVKFFLNDFDRAPQSIDYRNLFFYRSGMTAEETGALYAGKMLKSSLEIYAPLTGSTSAVQEPPMQEAPENRAQSLNTLSMEEQETRTGWRNIVFDKNMEIKAITIYSLTGQQLLHITESPFDYNRKLPAGIYIVKVISTQGVELSKQITGISRRYL